MRIIRIKKKQIIFFAFIFLLFFTESFLLGEQISGSSYFSVDIPDYDPNFPYSGWVYSSIYIYGAPADAVVSGIDVTFSCTHSWAADLDIDLNDEGLTRNYDLWQNEGGINPYRTRTNITTFNGLPVNGTWKLYAKDCYEGVVGNIDLWTITIYYESNQKTYYVESIIANPNYGTDADNDEFYETFNFEIWVAGSVSSGSENVYAKVTCDNTEQFWWSYQPLTIYPSGTNYYSFSFNETDFAGHINGNTNLDFTVEFWDSTKTIPLAVTHDVIDEPIKADDYIPPTYWVYGKIDSKDYKIDVDGDYYYETFSFRIGVDGDVFPGSATINAKIICDTTGQEWWFPSSWTISGFDYDYQYFEFDETFFSAYLSANGNSDLDFTVELWDSTKSTKLVFNEEVSGEPIKADYFSGPPATVTVHGKMEYSDRYNNRHPIRYAKIEIFDYNTVAPIGTSTTDEYGEYSITVNNDDPNDESAADIIVKVLPEGTAGAYPGTNSTIGILKDPDLNMPWHMISQTYLDNLKSDLEINLTVSNSSDNAGAFSVYDAIVEAFIKTFTIYNQEMPGITVIWQEPPPQNGGEGTCYDFDENKIYLITLERWDRDVILHEYGHFIQDILGFQNGPVGNNDHWWSEDLRYYAAGTPVSRTDEEAMNLAFREAWPTFFSISVQYGDNSFPNSGDSIYQDTEDPYIDIKDDLEHDTSFHFSPGEFYESMNCCILWDIFDTYDSAFDNKDTLVLGHDAIWNIVRNNKPNRINEFWNSWSVTYGYAREMTRIFLDHRISFIAQTPSDPSPRDGSANNQLSLALDWDDAPNATSYDVYFGPSGNLQFLENKSGSDYFVWNLEYATEYKWQIIARDSYAEAEGPLWTFYTMIEHTVSPPTITNGPSVGDKNISHTYTTGGASCSYNHIVQYRFDWGNGTFSDWSTSPTASYSWSEYGTYTVKAQARCANDTTIISSFSTGKTVTIEKPHIVTTPSIPVGPDNGLENISSSYTTGGSSCSHEHSIEYRFDWGDGSFSGWVTSSVASHSWSDPGTYAVRAQARCASNPDVVSGFSQGFMVNVSETHSLSVQSGIITGIPVTASPNDLNNSGNGSTNFTRIYNPGTVVTLTASPTYNDNDFVKWVIDGIEDLNQTVQINMDQDHIVILYYYIPQEPEIKIKDAPLDGEELSHNSSYDFGNLKINFYEEVLWLVVNEGVIDLELPGSPPIMIEGIDSDQFIVSQQPWSVMAPGEGSIFRIRFAPTTEGTKYAKISIANNDTNENPYEINLIGTGLPEVGIPSIQREALIALYNSTNGDNWTDNSGWKEGELEPDGFAARGTENSWYGVFCSYDDTVTSINLSDNNLVGTIPPELGNIKDLEFLHLSNNHLNGNIPTELGNVTDLFSLLINGNKLKGSLPTSLANLTRLGQTNIGYNLLYTDDDNLRSFLNNKDPDWESTQTLAPTSLTAVDQSNFYIELNWNPIQYTSNPGGYRVFYSTTPGGPYTFFDSTSDKTITSMKVTGLSPGINYYFVVQTRTEPSAFNQNILDSDYSEELAASTTAVSAINVTSPNGGESWEVNSVHNITWNSYGLSGNIKIEYSTDNGNTWKLVTSSTENDGSYPWLIPYDVSSQCKIRLGYEGTSFIDTSDEVFSIVLPLQLIMVASPNGGETWNAGSTPYITWTTHGPLGTLIIEYSTDNGVNWNLIDYTENDGSHPWTIPVIESSFCLVRISQMGGTPSDTSDTVFTIINEIPSITITSPNGGENWPARSYKEITWTSNNVDGNVKIEYTINGGSTWKEIVSSTENDGSYYWSVVNDPWPICYLRISEIDGDPSDTSDYPFALDYPPSQRISEIERMALIDLYNSTNGDSWTNNSGWKTPPLDTDGFAMPGTEYTWYGVNVVAYWDVQGLALSNNNLSGFIPNSIGNLSQLVSLNLSWNQITQSIPQSIGNLQNLLFLYLNANQLNGAIPSTLGNLSNIAYIYLDNNQLSGSIPAELENLSNLITLSLCINNFSGEIPAWLGNLPELKYLYLFRNSFTGAIPSSLGNISGLRTLWLSNNYLTGSIPEELGNLINLNYLNLHSNLLEGSIPASLGNLSNLGNLFLYNNRLSGNIPEELGNLSNLNSLYLQSNLLTGGIPLTLTNLTNLGSSSTDIGYNALYTNDETLRTFLNGKDPDWESTQTIVPADVSAAALSGDSIQLNWTPITYIGDTGGYQVYFSMTSGGPYTLYDTTTNKTTSSMIVTGLDPGTTYYFKVQSVTDPHQNNQNMVISENSPEVSAETLSLFYIRVTSPNGDENYEVGALQNITWTTMGPVGDVKIEYSTDNGSTWIQIVGSTVNDGMHPWTIPDNTSSNCLVKINEVNGSLADTSNNTFSIVPVPNINITFPAGGESFEVGSLQNLTWSSLGTVGNLRIEYSTDNGLNWIYIVSSTANDGVHSWTIPDSISSQSLIRISELDGNPSKTSAVFSIVPQPSLSLIYPNGGEDLEVRSKQGVTWSSIGNIESVKIEYSTDNGSNWTEVASPTENDGFNLWQIPDAVSSQCLLKISEVSGSLVDTSDSLFSIIPEPSIALISPDGGESFEVGSSPNITWSTTGAVGNVRIEYSTDNGAQWSEIVSSTENDGSYEWIIPDTVSSQSLARISEIDGEPIDTSKAIFSIVPGPSITVDSPNGGENFEVGTTQNITWTTTGTVVNVRIEYSTDNGANWTEIVSSTENNSSYLWAIPDTISSQCKVRISEIDGDPSDTSDDIFSIVSIPSITVISPDGGEKFEVGSSQNIQWTTTGIVGNIKIEYSTNNGSSWIEIIASTENDGSYTWVTPNAISSQCLIKISEIGEELSDTSDNAFLIVPVPLLPEIERNALIDLYSNTNGDNWPENSGWKNPPLHTDGFAMPGTEESWAGITIDNNHVIKIELINNNLSGSIPASISNLSNLQLLNLSQNQLTGNIPSSLGNFSNLKFLYLQSNQLTGNIPPELGNMANLLGLYLNDNEFSNDIPSEIGNISGLLYLELQSNLLSGMIPQEFSNLLNLQILKINSNKLSGRIPIDLKNLTGLSNSDTDIGYNALYTDDADLLGFLNNKDLDWADTQTIAPSDVSATVLSENSIQLNWTPIPYSTDNGGYLIFYSINIGGDYTLFDTTVDKTISSSVIAGLTPNTTYYFLLQTKTDPHENNNNTVISKYSNRVTTSTAPIPVIDVTSPNGGENFEIGSIQNITWSTTGIVGNIRIEYSIDNGANWIEIISSTENDGAHYWTIPDTVSSQCLIRVSEIDGTPADVSNGPFAIVPVPIISGIVTVGGSGLANVVMTGLPGNPVTNSEGFYSATVNYGWSGTVTPTLAGYTFTELSTTYTNVTSNQTTNYTATLLTYTISGTVTSDGSGLGNVVMNGLPGNPSTDQDGTYTATVNYGWSGTVTPTLAGYAFTEPSTTYTNVTANKTTNYIAALLTYTISGTVTEDGSGLSGVVMTGLHDNPVTDSNGNYTATVDYGWSGTVIPTLEGYTFTEPSTIYTNVTSNQTKNYTATLLTYTISGQVTSGGSGLENVVMNGLPGNPATDSEGNYTATVDYGWSGTVTPTLAGYTFTEPSTTYTSVTSNQTANYTATLLTYTISGQVTCGGSGLENVIMNGLPGNPVTDSGGSYTATVDYGWSGTVTPTLAGYTFTEPSVTYTNITSDQTTNYTAALQTFTVSGTVTTGGVGLANVVMNGLPGDPVTDSSGFYTATVDYGWSGTVTPTMAGYNFTEPSTTYPSVTSNQTTNYTATLLTYTISGQVTSGGSGLENVLMNGLPGNPVTDSNGDYTSTVEYNWSGTVTPTLPGYTFTAPSTTYNSVTSNQTTNYTSMLITYTVSGQVTVGGTGLENVIMNGLPDNPVTDSNGNYTATVDYGWSGTVTPTLAGYTFTEPSTTYTNVTSNQTTNYTATLLTYTISGQVTCGGSGLENVVMNGLPGNPLTDSEGNYTAAVDYGWSGTVTPTLAGYTFAEPSTTYNNVTSNQATNYTATLLTYMVSGTVSSGGTGLANVVMSGLPGNPLTDSEGNYTAAVDYGWSGTVTPTLAGYTFTEPSTTYTNVTSDQTTNYTATLLTYTISGTITSGGTGLENVVMTGLPGNPLTDSQGNYTATVNYGWSGTATPTLAGYTFTEPSTTYTNITSNQTTNYTATLLTYTISGQVTIGGTGLENVVMNGLPGNPLTDSQGNYTATVDYGWSGTVTPTMAGYNFTEPSTTYPSVTSNQTTNYTATLLTYTISGQVTSGGSGLENVVMTGLPGNPFTDSEGNYTATVNYGWSGTVTPTFEGYTFTAPSTSYTNVTANQTTDYMATLLTYTISGTVTEDGSGLAGVVMTGLPDNPVTDSNGNYTATVDYGWSGTVTPTMAGYNFTEPSTTYPSVTSNQTTNYTATLLTYTISGQVTSGGSGLENVVMTGLPGNPFTDSEGNYTATVNYGWSGTVTPTLAGYTFTAPSTTYSNVTSNQTTDYMATLLAYTISGTVTEDGSGLAGVVMTGLPDNPVTDSNGNYTATVDYGWSGTVTPTMAGYNFTEPSTTYPSVTSNQTTNYTATLLTYTISGQVTSGGSGLENVVMTGLPGNPFTDSEGNYTATVNYGWSGTVTPTFEGYTFTAPSTSYTNVTANQTTDYMATLLTYTISGTVTEDGSGLAGVVMTGLPDNPVTDSNGNYTATVDYGWSGTVTPTLTGYIFTEPSTTYSNVTSNQTTNYTATLLTYTISGQVTSGGSGLENVVMTGLPGNPFTDSEGNYTATVNYGWSGTVTPTLAGYTFTAPSTTYSNVTSNQTTDYMATLLAYTISGTVTEDGSGLAGVVMTGLPDNPVTDSNGNYTATVDYGWSGTVTPTMAGYNFTEPSTTYPSVTSNQTTNYTATLLTYTISGQVTSGGSGLENVLMNGLPGNPVTDSNGNYTSTVEYNWSGTVTPTLPGYTFTAPSTTYNSVTSNQTTNYTSMLITYTVSGQVTVGGTGLENVIMNGLPGNPLTNSEGNYTATVDYGWSGTVTPTLAGYTFTEPSVTYTNVTSNKTTNYAATLLTYTISGQVTLDGSGLENVVLNGLPGNPLTDSQGNYTATVDYGWSGTVTPTLAGYTFTEPSTTYTNITSNQTTNYTATLLTYTISGQVTIGGTGLENVVMNGLPGNPLTDSGGNYSATVDYGWSGTVTPTLAGYTFTESSTTYTNITSNQTTNYTATLLTYTISGYVTLDGSGLDNVLMDGLPGNPVTNSEGFYTATVDYGWSGTVTATLAGYTFTEPSTTYTNVTSNQTTNYTATLLTYTISGVVTFGGVGLENVVMNGLPGNPLTGQDGSYTATVNYGWSGTVTPTLAGYIFTEPSTTYPNVTSDQTTNYTATLLTYTISGTVTCAGSGLENVVMNGLPGNPVTDSNGNYTATVNYGWSGTVTPTRECYTFEELFTSYSNVISNQSTNYEATLLIYTISGIVTWDGSGLESVVMNGLPGNPVTDSEGIYTATVDCGWSGTVTPTLAGYAFTEPSTTYTNVTSNQETNYSATVLTYTIAGTVTLDGSVLENVIMNGLPGNPATNDQGIYTATVDYGWSGTVTPTLAGYIFTEPSTSYTNVTSNQSTNYSAALIIPSIERNAIIDLYNNTNGDNWTDNNGWKTPPLHTDGFAIPGTEGYWTGITVENGDVVKIALGGNNLSGAVPASIDNLTNLQELHLHQNQLTGEIPFILGNLSSLNQLYLNNNQLTGMIPSELENLLNLTHLYLHANQLSGSIPTSICNLLNLVSLNLSINQLTGNIPPQLGDMPNLEELRLYENQLEGSIPSELGNLSKLTYLTLGKNQLTGPIPPSLGALTNLESLYLYDNQLTDGIPQELGNLLKLKNIGLNGNRLTGSIPTSLTNLSLLSDTNTDIGYNALYTDDETLRSFLNSKDPDWESTQTIAPIDVSAVVVSESSVEVSWTPIVYTGDSGEYRIHYGTNPDGPYPNSVATEDKTASSITVTGLIPTVNYYFVVQTRTEPHDNNENTVESEYSEEVPVLSSITVTSPNGGETLEAGSPYVITWTSTGTISNVTIEYSINNGASWRTIVSATGNTGSHNWIVPGNPSENCLIRISGSDSDGGPEDVSDAVFSIVSTTPPSLRVTSPNGGERFTIGSLFEITWASNGPIGDVKIEYSIDNGSFWITIVPSTDNDGSYTWTVPDTPSESCLVRISESDKDAGISDISDGGFFIVPAPFITITSPNGSETWEVGAPHNITWNSSETIGNIRIEYSTNNGTSWTTIAASTDNTGSFNWTVPGNLSENCLIRISEAEGDTSDVSDGVFSIVLPPSITVTSPNGGENWPAGSKHDITWSNIGTIGNVKIEYSTDNGTNWKTIAESLDNDGSYNWTVADNPSENCLVRISESDKDGGPSDISDAQFSITPAPVITITSPNGGEKLAAESAHEITWTGSQIQEEVKIEYSTDNGASWINIVLSTLNDGSHSWTVPDNPAETCLIRISETDGEPSDVSDSVFSIVSSSTSTITVTSPNGGENVTVGETHEITWTSTGMGEEDTVIIEYSTDNGTTWLNIVPSTANIGSYHWTVPDNPSENGLIRIVGSDSDEGPSDVSDSVFSIVLPSTPTITVTSPNGGESLAAGTTHEITWISSGMENVENIIIEYSTDSGTTWTTIVFSTSDIEAYSWTVPDNPSGNCLIRIRLSDSDEGPTDVSDEVFSIVSASSITVTSPNGGEKWKTGSTYDITWTSTGITGDIVIDLYSGSSFDLNIGTISVESGSFAWDIPGNFTTGDDYKILLHKDSTEDDSDANFSIVEKEPNHPDFNNDGNVDILWRNYATGNNEVWLMNGSQRVSSSSLAEMLDLNWRIVGTGDFNRDGKVDILWRNYTNGQNQVWYMDGTTQTGSEYLLNQPDSNWKIAGTGDFNGDAAVDILWRNSVEGRNMVWYMDGVTRIAYMGLPAIEGQSWQIAGTGDFNGDNKVDILWRNDENGSNQVWIMDGVTRIGTADLIQETDLDWRIVGTGDFNLDGAIDILWRRYSDGQNMIWYMAGVVRTGYEYIETRSDLNWRIVNNGD